MNVWREQKVNNPEQQVIERRGYLALECVFVLICLVSTQDKLPETLSIPFLCH